MQQNSAFTCIFVGQKRALAQFGAERRTNDDRRIISVLPCFAHRELGIFFAAEKETSEFFYYGRTHQMLGDDFQYSSYLLVPHPNSRSIEV